MSPFQNYSAPQFQIKRFPIADNKLDWSIDYADYKPPYFTSPKVSSAEWADPDIKFEISFDI